MEVLVTVAHDGVVDTNLHASAVAIMILFLPCTLVYLYVGAAVVVTVPKMLLAQM